MEAPATQATATTINLQQLLKAMVEKGASDLHLTTGTPPQLRIVQLSTYQLLRHRDAPNQLRNPDGPMDIIIAAGILDYLKDNVIARFLEAMLTQLAPGGLLLLTNLHQENPWRSFMEYVCDWYVIHRTREQFQGLCEGPPSRGMKTVETVVDASSGTNIFWAGQKLR